PLIASARNVQSSPASAAFQRSRTGAGGKGRPESRSQNDAAVAGESQRSPRRCFWLGDAPLRLGGGCAARLDRLPTGGGLAALLACFWLEVFWSNGLESGIGSVRRAAVYVRHDRFLAACAGHRCAAVDRRGSLHYRDVSGRAARDSFFYHGTFGRHP